MLYVSEISGKIYYSVYIYRKSIEENAPSLTVIVVSVLPIGLYGVSVLLCILPSFKECRYIIFFYNGGKSHQKLF